MPALSISKAATSWRKKKISIGFIPKTSSSLNFLFFPFISILWLSSSNLPFDAIYHFPKRVSIIHQLIGFRDANNSHCTTHHQFSVGSSSFIGSHHISCLFARVTSTSACIIAFAILIFVFYLLLTDFYFLFLGLMCLSRHDKIQRLKVLMKAYCSIGMSGES